MIAFAILAILSIFAILAIEDFLPPKKLKNDPSFVKWVFRVYGR